MGEPLDSEKLAEMEDAFAFFDEDGDGIIKYEDVGPLLWAVGMIVTESDVAEILGKINPSGEGAFNFDAFVAAMNYLNNTLLKQKLLSFVKEYDKTSSGCVHVDTLRWVLNIIGIPLTDSAFDSVLADVPVNADNTINYTDFIDNLLQ